MELFFPLLALFLVYLASWAAGLYLLLQCVLLRQQWVRERNWLVLWVWVWAAFGLALLVTLVRLPPIWAVGRVGLFAPLFWFFSLRVFRKNRQAERRAQAEAAGRLAASQEETVWPPAPLKK